MLIRIIIHLLIPFIIPVRKYTWCLHKHKINTIIFTKWIYLIKILHVPVTECIISKWSSFWYSRNWSYSLLHKITVSCDGWCFPHISEILWWQFTPSWVISQQWKYIAGYILIFCHWLPYRSYLILGKLHAIQCHSVISLAFGISLCHCKYIYNNNLRFLILKRIFEQIIRLPYKLFRTSTDITWYPVILPHCNRGYILIYFTVTKNKHIVILFTVVIFLNHCTFFNIWCIFRN